MEPEETPFSRTYEYERARCIDQAIAILGLSETTETVLASAQQLFDFTTAEKDTTTNG